MIELSEIRESSSEDWPALERLYPDAFPEEDLLPVVRMLLADEPGILSLVAVVDTAVAGHVVFTPCSVRDSSDRVALLAPLAVAPAFQRRGIGSAIVRAGLRRVKDSGVAWVCVLGDPAYYGRFGFATEADIAPPYPLPAAWSGAWQSISLRRSETPLAGPLSVPKPWRQPDLWAP